jgi:hypothetical protein
MKLLRESVRLLATAWVVFAAGGPTAWGDEGMWLFNNPPLSGPFHK